MKQTEAAAKEKSCPGPARLASRVKWVYFRPFFYRLLRPIGFVFELCPQQLLSPNRVLFFEFPNAGFEMPKRAARKNSRPCPKLKPLTRLLRMAADEILSYSRVVSLSMRTLGLVTVICTYATLISGAANADELQVSHREPGTCAGPRFVILQATPGAIHLTYRRTQSQYS